MITRSKTLIVTPTCVLVHSALATTKIPNGLAATFRTHLVIKDIVTHDPANIVWDSIEGQPSESSITIGVLILSMAMMWCLWPPTWCRDCPAEKSLVGLLGRMSPGSSH
ncbi:hypothetical protein DL95DRAFT_104582 [Leptodontidium sp. 2 PMI_412]|nr:hypothetical protein DL95DRAFT_104582 [Leptodontidium sp. 2 PMI_412]